MSRQAGGPRVSAALDRDFSRRRVMNIWSISLPPLRHLLLSFKLFVTSYPESTGDMPYGIDEAVDVVLPEFASYLCDFISWML